jgi:hypothetical protein
MLSVPTGSDVLLSVATPDERGAVPRLAPLLENVTFSPLVVKGPEEYGLSVAASIIWVPATDVEALAASVSFVASGDAVSVIGVEVLVRKFPSPA